MWWYAEQGAKQRSSIHLFTDVPCRNASDGCEETTSLKHTKDAELPKRLLCKRCQDFGTPSERYGQQGSAKNAKFCGDETMGAYYVNLDIKNFVACNVRVSELR